MSREVPAVVGILMMCVAIAGAGTDMGLTCFRDIETVDSTESLAVTLRSLKVRRVRLETVTPSDDSHYVTVKFDILNKGETSVSNIVFQVMLIDTRPDARLRIVAGPFTFRSKSALDAENTMALEVRVRDLAPSCRCRPFVRIASVSIP